MFLILYSLYVFISVWFAEIIFRKGKILEFFAVELYRNSGNKVDSQSAIISTDVPFGKCEIVNNAQLIFDTSDMRMKYTNYEITRGKMKTSINSIK